MGLYRNIVWFIKGMREYTSFVEKDLDVSMVGCSFMITGANSGIAMAIDKKGGTVYIVCRNKSEPEEKSSQRVEILFFQELSYRLFVSDRRPVSAHLPLAWTHSSRRDVKAFMGRLENLAMAVKPSD
ncbi:hypothetical protein cypCar_00019325 [Cyprinus carpio]|nr:hypothetical protein cypCar_00019325 [Cyprinus carpio]